MTIFILHISEIFGEIGALVKPQVFPMGNSCIEMHKNLNLGENSIER